jgi:hypothetical protein
MVEWQVVAAVALVIFLVLLFLIVKKGTETGVKVVSAFLKKAKCTFCCKLFGCNTLVDAVKPLCWACFGSFCIDC